MNKLLTLLLFTISAQGYAYDYIQPCEFFRIQVKNNTPFTCYLVQRSIQNGFIHKHQPYKIESGVSVTQFELYQSNFNPIRAVITYECSSNHSITFYSIKAPCTNFKNTMNIRGDIVKYNNMTAVFSTNESTNFLSKDPGSILWTIS